MATSHVASDERACRLASDLERRAAGGTHTAPTGARSRSVGASTGSASYPDGDGNAGSERAAPGGHRRTSRASHRCRTEATAATPDLPALVHQTGAAYGNRWQLRG